MFPGGFNESDCCGVRFSAHWALTSTWKPSNITEVMHVLVSLFVFVVLLGVG